MTLKLATLKGLCHGQKCLHLFSDSETYHEQMGPIPRSNGSLDIALDIALFGPFGRSYSSDRYSLFGKGPLAFTAMSAELPPFKNGERNSASASTLDHDITPLLAEMSVIRFMDG